MNFTGPVFISTIMLCFVVICCTIVLAYTKLANGTSNNIYLNCHISNGSSEVGYARQESLTLAAFRKFYMQLMKHCTGVRGTKDSSLCIDSIGQVS